VLEELELDRREGQLLEKDREIQLKLNEVGQREEQLNEV
jgi:hypothetical protein